MPPIKRKEPAAKATKQTEKQSPKQQTPKVVVIDTAVMLSKPNSTVITAEDIAASYNVDPKNPKERKSIVAMMQSWASDGHGTFITGRKGMPTRFVKGPAGAPTPVAKPKATTYELEVSDEDAEELDAVAAKNANTVTTAEEEETPVTYVRKPAGSPPSTRSALESAADCEGVVTAHARDNVNVVVRIPYKDDKKIVMSWPNDIDSKGIKAVAEFINELTPNDLNKPKNSDMSITIHDAKGKMILPLPSTPQPTNKKKPRG